MASLRWIYHSNIFTQAGCAMHRPFLHSCHGLFPHP
jgi:hypothetical protein